MLKCKTGVMWKGSAASFVLNGVESVSRLADELASGTYRPRRPRAFTVTAPKRREIVSIAFRDRVYQRSLNDNVVYPAIARRLIYDNAACQKGKGTDFARNRLKCHLQRHFRKHGTDGWVLQVDVKGYYPNMRHEVAEAVFRENLPEWAWEMARDILRSQYPGDVGYNPGSQIVQIAGIAVLDRLDHFIKERLRVRHYIRYMDDMVLIHEDRGFLERCLDAIDGKLAEIGFEHNARKTRIRPISAGIAFLGFDFQLKPTGKVLMTVRSESVKRMRRRIRRMAALAKKGYRTRETVDEAYQSWRNHAAKGDSWKLLARCDRWYSGLWKEAA